MTNTMTSTMTNTKSEYLRVLNGKYQGDFNSHPYDFGFELDDCCWSAKLVLRRHREKLRENLFIVRKSPEKFLQQLQETGIYFEFELKGLASIGRRIDSLLDYSLQGIK